MKKNGLLLFILFCSNVFASCNSYDGGAATDGKGDITGMTPARIKSFNLKDRNGKTRRNFSA